MITQYDVHTMLQEQLPDMAVKSYSSRVSFDVYASLSDFTDYTKHAVEAHQFDKAKKCFALAEDMYINGDKLVQHLIENSFIYAFSAQKARNGMEHFILKSIIPKTLYAVYKKRLIQNGN